MCQNQRIFCLWGHPTHGTTLSTWTPYSWCNIIFYYACNLAPISPRSQILNLKKHLLNLGTVCVMRTPRFKNTLYKWPYKRLTYATMSLLTKLGPITWPTILAQQPSWPAYSTHRDLTSEHWALIHTQMLELLSQMLQLKKNRNVVTKKEICDWIWNIRCGV